MNSPTERLSHIKNMHTYTIQLNLKLNLYYYKTITSLSISSRSYNTRQDTDTSLVRFASHFPYLTSLRMHGPYIYVVSVDAVDLIRFLEAAPQIQTLHICDFYKIVSNTKPISENLCLTVLDITVTSMDIRSLVLITTRLKKLNLLRLRIDSLILAVPQERIGMRRKFSPEKLLNGLKNYTSGISKVFISFGHMNERYVLEHNEDDDCNH